MRGLNTVADDIGKYRDAVFFGFNQMAQNLGNLTGIAQPINSKLKLFDPDGNEIDIDALIAEIRAHATK